MNKVLFCESQGFSRPWLTWLLVCLEFLLLGLLSLAFIQNKILNVSSLIIPLILFLLPLFFLFLTFMTRFDLKIDQRSILFKWHPFEREFNIIELDNVKSIKVISFNFIGLGYRVSSEYGVCHIVKGNYGIQIETICGRKFLIGTQKVKLLNNVLEEINIG